MNERSPSILCTFPGKYGDILWALPTVRALSEAYGTPVDIAVAAPYTGLVALLQRQPYIRTAWGLWRWEVQQTAPMTPRVPPVSALPHVLWDRYFHLGYERWPEPTLARDIYQRAYLTCYKPLPSPQDFSAQLDRPWITTPGIHPLRRPEDKPVIWVGWSEEHFELKVGLLVTVAHQLPEVEFWWVRPSEGRYDEVDRRCAHRGCGAHLLGPNVAMIRADWRHTAALGQVAQVYWGCLSSQWVLANALGRRCVVTEPNEHRWHPVFWREAETHVMVRGNDGQPTFDARHTVEALRGVLAVAMQDDRPELRATGGAVWNNDQQTAAAKAGLGEGD